MSTARCVHCGRPFVKRRSHQRYCGALCKQGADQQRRKSKAGAAEPPPQRPAL